MTKKAKHLSREELGDLLMQKDGAETPHLADCAECRQELLSLRQTLGDFRMATTGLAAAQAPAELTQRVVKPARGSRLRGFAWAGSLATLAATVALSISLLHSGAPATHGNRGSGQHGDVQVAVGAAQPAAVSDEALMDGIDQDLATSIPPSLAPLDVPANRAEGSLHN
jgi:predicted anti-sigma-YlaC factor YlaD